MGSQPCLQHAPHTVPRHHDAELVYACTLGSKQCPGGNAGVRHTEQGDFILAMPVLHGLPCQHTGPQEHAHVEQAVARPQLAALHLLQPLNQALACSISILWGYRLA